MIEIGRVCVKLAGRDAGKRCVVVDLLDDKFVLIDGETRRRKCNIAHLEPLPEILNVKKGASHDEVIKLFKEFGVELRQTKKKQVGQKPTRQRKQKAKPVEAKEEKKPEAAKEAIA